MMKRVANPRSLFHQDDVNETDLCDRVLWGGVFLYVKESHYPETMERYGRGTPDDWLERNVYSRFQVVGLTLMGVIYVALLGIGPGLLSLATQIVWIPFWAAGVINGIGQFFVNSALNRDYSMIMGITILTGALTILFNLLVDVLYAWIDPKIRY